ncbi:soluble lytic murein transglycosylase-like protein [Rhizobium petrolearium]|uniref:lytic transglycosylase domain-containing protein n=1 Tax=Neorhizobium petrolearium TaxID=515361 RepID=UPI001F2F6FBE|nr:lytic transglycosylase domain-containing protein [Neorhizobium petrolearium]MBP1844956.1 soluble lytic murein transglycosylase-like protein [Neorhizobium petrolearium]
MAIIRFLGRGTAVACAISSALAGCSSVEREPRLAATQTTTPANGQPAGSVQTASADGGSVIQYRSDLPVGQQLQTGAQLPATTQLAGTQPTIALAKSGRLAVPVPSAVEAASVQTAAMASPTMAPLVAFAPASLPVQPATPATSTAVASVAAAPAPVPATSTILAASKSGRITSPMVAPAVAEGRIQPAAAQAIALDEPELTPDMVALQSVVPTPRPQRPDTTTLAYAAQPKAVAALSAMEFPPAPGDPLPATAADAPPQLNMLIKRYAGIYGVPESLVHRVVHRESRYDPKAYHKNGYWGLMQIKYSTAKSMGYEGPPEGLLDAETNLKYAIKYLRGAWLVADNKNDNAIRLYARGYYYDAKRKDMLHVLQK